jgi:hypothetical protein
VSFILTLASKWGCDIVACFENFTSIPNICGTIGGSHIPLANLPNKRVKLFISDVFNKIS